MNFGSQLSEMSNFLHKFTSTYRGLLLSDLSKRFLLLLPSFLHFIAIFFLPPLYLRMFSTCSSYIWTTSVVVYYHITVFVFRCLPIFALPIFVLPKFVPSYICVPINGSSCNWFFLGPFLPIKWVGTSHGKYMIIDHKPNQCQLHVFFFCTIFFTPAKICFLQ